MDFLRSSREKINFSPIPLPLRIATGLKQIIVFKWAIEWYWSPPLAASTEEHFFQNFHIIARLSREVTDWTALSFVLKKIEIGWQVPENVE